jgi:hypothetical protein
MDEKQRIIQEILRVARSISPARLTQKLFRQNSSISTRKVEYHFGTWNRAIEAAGLDPNPPGVPVSGYRRIADEELIKEIGELWKRTGKRPTQALMNSQGKYSEHPYLKRWGSVSAAVDLYVQQFGEPSIEPSLTFQETTVSPPKSSPVIIPKTHRPKPTVTKKRSIVYGEPIDFRGLRYAPVNEQGVVYLFGMISRELGFLIESVRTDFPDCEGKRYLNSEGTKLQHVRIEFEYKSSNFAEHGHDAEKCDLIVCWIHDWEDCPLEVLELKSTLTSLPKG